MAVRHRYSQDKKNVPRWFPRWTAWHSLDEVMNEKNVSQQNFKEGSGNPGRF